MTLARPARLGAVFAVLAFGAWGIVPLYWREVAALDPIVVLAQRIVWSALFVVGILLATGRMREGIAALRSPASLRYLVPSALLIAVNWGIFIWAVLAHELANVSLGYFMNPLANVLLGVICSESGCVRSPASPSGSQVRPFRCSLRREAVCSCRCR